MCLYFFWGSKLCSMRKTVTRRQTEDSYIDPHLLLSRIVPYSEPHLGLLLLLGPGDTAPLWALAGCSRDSVSQRLHGYKTAWLTITAVGVRVYIISQRQRQRLFGFRPMWPVPACQPAWAAFTHVSLSFCLHIWNMTALSKVNMQQLQKTDHHCR